MSIKEHNQTQIDYFEKNEKKTMQPRQSVYIDRHVEKMIEEACLAPEDSIIDVGCGIGKYTINLAKRGYRVEGTDLAQGLLDQFRDYDDSIPLYCFDIVDPPEALWGKYDVVIGFFTLHHLFDLEKSFEGIAKLLKPEGRVVFIEPNPYNLLYYVQIAITPRMKWEGDKGILNMRQNVIFPAMKAGGFQNSHHKRFGFFPPFAYERMPKVDEALARVPLWRPLLPFQVFGAQKCV